MSKKPEGWRNESFRHELASRGIRTTLKRIHGSVGEKARTGITYVYGSKPFWINMFIKVTKPEVQLSKKESRILFDIFVEEGMLKKTSVGRLERYVLTKKYHKISRGTISSKELNDKIKTRLGMKGSIIVEGGI